MIQKIDKKGVVHGQGKKQVVNKEAKEKKEATTSAGTNRSYFPSGW